MANTSAVAAAPGAVPAIRKITVADLIDVIDKGWADFMAKPTIVPMVIVVYAAASLIAFAAFSDYDMLPLVFPIVSGGVLLGPFATIAMAEVSRRRERGLPIEEMRGYDFIHSPSIVDIVLLGGMMVAMFFFWMTTAMTIFAMTVGDPWRSLAAPGQDFGEFIRLVLSTGGGWALIVLGNGIGLLFAIASLCISAISFPVLLDREVGIGVAVQTSIRACVENPVVMGAWGLIVTGTLIIGALPALAGLVVVMPVLGHATWHLYRKLVVQ
jgi:uncharacterized membrane protein